MRFGSGVLLGNWREDDALDEMRMMDHTASKETQSLTLLKKQRQLAPQLVPVPLSPAPADNAMHVGDTVLLQSLNHGGEVSVSMGNPFASAWCGGSRKKAPPVLPASEQSRGSNLARFERQGTVSKEEIKMLNTAPSGQATPASGFWAPVEAKQPVYQHWAAGINSKAELELPRDRITRGASESFALARMRQVGV